MLENDKVSFEAVEEGGWISERCAEIRHSDG